MFLGGLDKRKHCAPQSACIMVKIPRYLRRNLLRKLRVCFHATNIVTLKKVAFKLSSNPQSIHKVIA